MSEWISVEDRLPKSNKKVLIFVSSHWIGSYFKIASLGGDRKRFNSLNDYYNISDVTHWMPLPEAPHE